MQLCLGHSQGAVLIGQDIYATYVILEGVGVLLFILLKMSSNFQNLKLYKGVMSLFRRPQEYVFMTNIVDLKRRVVLSEIFFYRNVCMIEGQV